MAFYPPHATVPSGKRTERLVLRPLSTTDVELDYDAVMSSAPQLRSWSQSEWPAGDFTLAGNLADLERHEREHLERVAFTFTVLDPAETRCLGCVYFTPLPVSFDRLRGADAPAARVGFWVRTSEIEQDLDGHLLATLREWLRKEWAFERVFFAIAPSEERQAGLMRDAGLTAHGSFALQDGRACLVFS